jgi:hypothetical protein
MGGVVMGFREKIEDKIRKKEQEIKELEVNLRETIAYLQALQDTIKIMPREEVGSLGRPNNKPEKMFRSGSNISKAHDYLKQAKKPMYIEDILKAIGKTTSKADRSALAGALSWYVRQNQVFTRPSPGTYGLKEMDVKSGESAVDLWDRIREEIKKSGKLPLAAKMKVATPKELNNNVLSVSECTLPFKPDEIEAIKGAMEALGGFRLKIANGSLEDAPPANFGIDFNDAEEQSSAEK